MTRRAFGSLSALIPSIKIDPKDNAVVTMEKGKTYTIFLDAAAVDISALENMPPLSIDCECIVVFVLPPAGKTVHDCIAVVEGKA